MFKIVMASLIIFGLNSTDQDKKSKTIFMVNPQSNHINYKSNAFKTPISTSSKNLNSVTKKTKSNRDYKRTSENRLETSVQVANVNSEKNSMKNRNYKQK